MNFNYRDFFIHNDDLHIIKEQLSILDEIGVSIEDALAPNAKAVWDMYDKGEELDEQKIADKLGINVDTVKKIIDICEKKFLENKTIKQISDETKIATALIYDILNNAIPDWERKYDTFSDALDIYNLHKEGKSPEEIVNLINQKRKSYLQIKLDKVNLVLNIVDIATKQMEDPSNHGKLNISDIEKQINGVVTDSTITKIIRSLGIGEIRYRHKFTEEQHAFILFNYLQGIGPTASAGKFNEKFSNKSKQLNIYGSSILYILRNTILKPKGESDISDYIVKLLTMYKDTYFQAVNIEDLDTKDLLTHYRPPETVRGRDPLARKGGKVDPTRQMSGQTGNLEPDIHQTINTGESPASGQLGPKYGAPINPQGALSL